MFFGLQRCNGFIRHYAHLPLRKQVITAHGACKVHLTLHSRMNAERANPNRHKRDDDPKLRRRAKTPRKHLQHCTSLSSSDLHGPTLPTAPHRMVCVGHTAQIVPRSISFALVHHRPCRRRGSVIFRSIHYPFINSQAARLAIP